MDPQSQAVYVHEVVECQGKLYVLGSLADRSTVAIHVLKSKPFFVLPASHVSDPDHFVTWMRDSMSIRIQRYEKVQRRRYNLADLEFVDGRWQHKRVDVYQFYVHSNWNLRQVEQKLPNKVYIDEDEGEHTLKPWCAMDWSMQFRGLQDVKLFAWYRFPHAVLNRSKSAIRATHQWSFDQTHRVVPVESDVLQVVSVCTIRTRVVNANLLRNQRIGLPKGTAQEDKLLAVSARFEWMGDDEKREDRSFDSVEAFADWFEARDPHFVVYSDETYADHMVLFHQLDRIHKSHILSREVLKRDKSCAYKTRFGDWRLQTVGRTFINFNNLVKKEQLRQKLEEFTLARLVESRECYAGPPEPLLASDDVSQLHLEPDAETMRQHALDVTAAEVRVLCHVYHRRRMLNLVVAVSNAMYTPIDAVCNRGTTIRTECAYFNAFLKHEWFVDCHTLGALSARVPGPSDYEDPEERPNPTYGWKGTVRGELESKGSNALKSCTQSLAFVTQPVATKRKSVDDYKATDKQYQGGDVSIPIPGFYAHPLQMTGTLDFKSLYPSSMLMVRLCYASLLSPECWATVQRHPQLDQLKLKKIAYGGQCVLFAQNVDNVTSMLLTDCLDQRKAIKKKMKSAHGFQRELYDSQQLERKLAANSNYGFHGYKRNPLRCYEVAAGTTQIGRYVKRLTEDMSRVGVTVNDQHYKFDVMYGGKFCQLWFNSLSTPV